MLFFSEWELKEKLTVFVQSYVPLFVHIRTLTGLNRVVRAEQMVNEAVWNNPVQHVELSRAMKNYSWEIKQVKSGAST